MASGLLYGVAPSFSESHPPPCIFVPLSMARARFCPIYKSCRTVYVLEG